MTTKDQERKAELAVEKEAQCRKEAESLQEQLKEAKQIIEELQERAREAEQLAKKRYMMPHVYERLYEILEEKGREADRRMRETASTMADYVGKENVSPSIYDAAEAYRKYRAEKADSVMLQQEIRRYKEDE